MVSPHAEARMQLVAVAAVFTCCRSCHHRRPIDGRYLVHAPNIPATAVSHSPAHTLSAGFTAVGVAPGLLPCPAGQLSSHSSLFTQQRQSAQQRLMPQDGVPAQHSTTQSVCSNAHCGCPSSAWQLCQAGHSLTSSSTLCLQWCPVDAQGYRKAVRGWMEWRCCFDTTSLTCRVRPAH